MPRTKVAILVTAAVVAASAFAPSAHANGRFPQATQLVVDPSDPLHIALRTTFGLVHTTDGGKTWRWVCEAALGYMGTFDPAEVVTSDGTIVFGLPDGLSRTTDRCTFTRPTGPFGTDYVIDLALDRTDTAHVISATSLAAGSPMGSHATLSSSSDNGKTWDSSFPFPDDFRPFTVDIAPSRKQRIYASGIGPFPRFALVERSDDSGATWGELSFDMGDATAPYIAGVHPTDPDRVYLRLDADDDRLLVSTNGGMSFDQIYSGGQLLGFAISPDGSKVAIGTPTTGVQVAPTATHSFAKGWPTAVRCLTWTKEGLYACGEESVDGYTIAISKDDGMTFVPLLHATDIEPLACGGTTTVGSTCPSYWPAISAAIGKADGGVDATIDTSVPVVDAPAVDDASASEPSAPPPPSSSKSCGCNTPGAARDGALIALVFGALAFVRRRR